MTLVATGLNYYPVRIFNPDLDAASLGRSSFTFDSTTDRFAYVGMAMAAETLAVVYFQTGTVTTGDTVLVQIESVTNGRPSGTIIAAGASVTVAIADTDDVVWKTATIGTPPSLTMGQEFAIVITHSSGAVPSMTFPLATSLQGNHAYSPLCLQDTGAGAWVRSLTPFAMIIEMGTTGVMPYPGLSPLTANGTLTAFNNASSPDEYAMKIVVPKKCRVIGVSCVLFNVAVAADFTMSLWPASSSVDGDALGQKLVDGDTPLAITADGYFTRFFTPVTLTAGSTYYVGVRADTANNLAVGVLTTATVTNAIRGFPIPATCHLSTRIWTAGTAGAWTDTTTSLPLMSLIIDQEDDGAGGAGGIAHMAGDGGGFAG